MRQMLEIEEHVAVPPIMYSDPFYRITYLIKEEIRKHKWILRLEVILAKAGGSD